jgi:predicted metal-binding membrane protein
MLEFVAGYLVVWILVGALGLAALQVLSVPHTATSGAIAFCIASLWELTRAKRRALIACHRTIPLAPNGWRAIADCTRYGCLHGRSCVASCWALMLAPMLTSHSPLLMGGVGLLCGVERYSRLPMHRVVATTLAIAALTNLVAALLA